MQRSPLNIIDKLHLPQSSFLRITCIAGFFLLVIVGIISIAVSKSASPEKAFHRLLVEYDRQYGLVFGAADVSKIGAAGTGVLAEQETEKLKAALDRMEKKAESAESLLSVLKRRRQLAIINAKYLPAYRQSAQSAATAYPHSDALAAIAAAAIVQGSAITKEADEELREFLPLLNYPRMEFFRLCLHVLLGSFQTPQKALDALPENFSSSIVPYTFAGRQDIALCAALLRIIRTESATAEVQDLLAAYSNGGIFEETLPPENVLNFAAEYFYDFGDPLRSASLFSYLPGNTALMRQADALWIGGYQDSAYNIWRILAQPDSLHLLDPNDFHVRALYNMALITVDDDEAARLYQLAASPLIPEEPASGFSLIRYSRFLAALGAAAALEGAGANDSRPIPGQTLETSRANILIDLELLRRHSEMREAGWITGALWQMLERYPDEEKLYQWAAWYFIDQRNYRELAILLKTIARHQFEGQWVDAAEAFLRLGEGDVNEAERIFLLLAATGTTDENADWDESAVAAANLGRIFESRRAPTRALEYYAKASALVVVQGTQMGNEEASRIQLRIALCQRQLGRFDECRRALDYALELNPDNLSAQLEINRLEAR